MKFTDIFIKKPVLATVINLFILFLGIRAGMELNVRQFPKMQNAVITTTTSYIGADANLVQGFITTPLENGIASAEGIDYITSTSLSGTSLIQAYVRLDYDPYKVLTQVIAKVNQLRGELPKDSEDPIVELSVGETFAAMYISFFSDILSDNQISDYLIRMVQPKLSTIPGVQQAKVMGGKFAMRIWLHADQMSALGITPSDVYNALQANNVLAAVGSIKGSMVTVNLTADTNLNTEEDFKRLVVRTKNNVITRLEDIATIELGSENYDIAINFNGKNATFMSIEVSPDANTLEVIKKVKKVFKEEIIKQLPQGLQSDIPYDSTRYIEDSIREVIKTIIEAIIIVIIVIYLFIGSLRSVVIPAIAVPLSLIGSLFLMLVMGFSINLLTLLAMVLAIGIVVDDAIIVLENIHRHVEQGMSVMEASLQGARELAWPVITMTTTLIAVYLPVGFMGGLTGTLFTEFAFALAGAVLLSGVVALTLSPVMCAKLLKPHKKNNKGSLENYLDNKFETLRLIYKKYLHLSLNDKKIILIFSIIVLLSCYFLFVKSSKELEPEEDVGIVIAIAEADPYVTLEYAKLFSEQFNVIGKNIAEVENVFLINQVGNGSVNSIIAGFVLSPASERKRTTQDLEKEIQAKVDSIAGLRIATFVPSSLPSGKGGLPVEVVIGTTEAVENLQEFANEIIQVVSQSKKFAFLNTDLKINKPGYSILIDREKASSLGVTMQSISNDLTAMLAGGSVNRFSMGSRSYKVIPQVQRVDRLISEQLQQFYTRTGTGKMIPLSTLVSIKETVEPQQLNRFQQLNSVIISGVPRSGVTLGEAISVVEEAAQKILPSGYSKDYSGQSRQYKQEGQTLIITFFFALLVIYLVLAAQFESFRDPLIMLITVPMSICGAMIFTCLGFTTINIYTQVGLVTLIGVISKHGILIVEFANKLQQSGYDKRRAIEEASSIRLRPVLMTTISLVLAMVPLLIASGPGAGARFSMGLVIAAGMTIGTIFTLFVVPAMYLYLGRE